MVTIGPALCRLGANSIFCVVLLQPHNLSATPFYSADWKAEFRRGHQLLTDSERSRAAPTFRHTSQAMPLWGQDSQGCDSGVGSPRERAPLPQRGAEARRGRDQL